MNAYGYDWHQTTVGRIETAQRPLRLNEAVDMGKLFGVALERLMPRPPDMELEQINEQIGHVTKAFGEVQEELSDLMRQETDIEKNLQEVSSRRKSAEIQAAVLRAELTGLMRAARNREVFG